MKLHVQYVGVNSWHFLSRRTSSGFRIYVTSGNHHWSPERYAFRRIWCVFCIICIYIYVYMYACIRIHILRQNLMKMEPFSFRGLTVPRDSAWGNKGKAESLRSCLPAKRPMPTDSCADFWTSKPCFAKNSMFRLLTIFLFKDSQVWSSSSSQLSARATSTLGPIKSGTLMSGTPSGLSSSAALFFKSSQVSAPIRKHISARLFWTGRLPILDTLQKKRKRPSVRFAIIAYNGNKHYAGKRPQTVWGEWKDNVI